jgi:protein SCO1/2
MNEEVTKQRNSSRRNLAILFSGLLAFAAGVVIWLQLAAPPALQPAGKIETKSATLLPQLKSLQPFSLKDQHGRTFANQDLLGQWTFLNFGYTHCPDICPTTLAMLKHMDELLQPVKESTPYQIAFVSVDPERDTQQRLAEYINYFEPSFLGIRGSDDELRRLTQPLGILYAKVAMEKSAMGYVMDHSAAIILVDPQGRYHALFSQPHDSGIMAQDFLMITGNY